MKAAPVEYVKVCPAFGPGFYYIPGSDTCLKVGGTVWVEGMYLQPYTKAQDQLGYRTNLTVSLDARTNTEYGSLRTVVAPQIAKRNGLEQSGSQEREGNATTNTNALSTAKQTYFSASGFIQFGGLTVGRLGSFFSNQFSFNDVVGNVGVDARDLVQTAGYTLTLGNGITLTGAIEDSTDASRDGVYGMFYDSAASTPKYVASVVSGQKVVGGNGNTNIATGVQTGVNYGGNRVPDAVLALKIDQAWGSANLAAMSHAINYSASQYTPAAAGSAAGKADGTSVTNGNQFSNEYGYAVQGGVKVNLPMIAAGDTLALNAIYASGFNQAVFRNMIGDRNSNDGGGWTGYNLGYNATATLADVVADQTTGKTYQAKSWGTAGEFTHYITPTFAAFIGGSYANLSWDAAAQQTAAINPAHLYNAYIGAIWSPVKDFKIIPEVFYNKITAKNAFAASGAEPAAKSLDAWQARIQVRRDF